MYSLERKRALEILIMLELRQPRLVIEEKLFNKKNSIIKDRPPDFQVNNQKGNFRARTHPAIIQFVNEKIFAWKSQHKNGANNMILGGQGPSKLAI